MPQHSCEWLEQMVLIILKTDLYYITTNEKYIYPCFCLWCNLFICASTICKYEGGPGRSTEVLALLIYNKLLSLQNLATHLQYQLLFLQVYYYFQLYNLGYLSLSQIYNA